MMKMVEREIFICDGCQKEYTTAYDAKACEHRHMQDACQHKNTEPSFEEGWEGDGLKIKVRCEDCNKIVEAKEVSIDKYDDTGPAIYSIVRPRTEEEQKILAAWIERLGIYPPITFDMIYAVIKRYERLEASIIANADSFTQDSIWEGLVDDQGGN